MLYFHHGHNNPTLPFCFSGLQTSSLFGSMSMCTIFCWLFTGHDGLTKKNTANTKFTTMAPTASAISKRYAGQSKTKTLVHFSGKVNTRQLNKHNTTGVLQDNHVHQHFFSCNSCNLDTSIITGDTCYSNFMYPKHM